MRQKGRARYQMVRGFTPILVLLFVALLAGGGYYVYKNFNLTPKVAILTSSPVPTATSNPTVNWKTYTNTDYKFQINYPGNWTIKEDKTLQGMALITVTIGAPSGNTLLDIWVRSGTWASAENELKTKSTPVIFDGIEGLVENFDTTKQYSFPSKIDNQIIQIVAGWSSDAPADEKPTLDQILSTFKFTN